MDQSPFPACAELHDRRRRQEYRGKDVVDAAHRRQGRSELSWSLPGVLGHLPDRRRDDRGIRSRASGCSLQPDRGRGRIGARGVGVRGGAAGRVTSGLALAISVQLAYRLALTNVAVIDICLVAAGFLLRAIAGGVAAEISLSMWFLLVMASGSIFSSPRENATRS